MKEIFENAELEVVELSAEAVILVSGDGLEDGNDNQCTDD